MHSVEHLRPPACAPGRGGLGVSRGVNRPGPGLPRLGRRRRRGPKGVPRHRMPWAAARRGCSPRAILGYSVSEKQFNSTAIFNSETVLERIQLGEERGRTFCKIFSWLPANASTCRLARPARPSGMGSTGPVCRRRGAPGAPRACPARPVSRP